MSGPRFLQSVSVVMPAYNEEAGIERAVRDALDYLPQSFTDWEVVVVDDGSRDATPAILARLAAQEPRLRIVTHEKNRGYGAAVRSALAAAGKSLVFFTDGDRQFDITELDDSIPLLNDSGADALFGFRVYRYDSVLRCLLSWVYNRIVRVLFRVRVRDVDASWKLFTRRVVDAIAPRLETTDFFIDTEIVARTAMLGFRTIETGVRHYPRTAGHTTVRASDIPRTLRTVFRMWQRIRAQSRRARAAAAPTAQPAVKKD
jgi:glycosyltransferase involved in cell wall biosynthesis